MANSIFSFIINSLVNLVSVFLTPFLTALQLLPLGPVIQPVLGFITGASYFIYNIIGLLAFALSYLAIPGPIISVLFLYVIFKIQVWLLIEVLKFLVYWWKVIKL